MNKLLAASFIHEAFCHKDSVVTGWVIIAREEQSLPELHVVHDRAQALVQLNACADAPEHRVAVVELLASALPATGGALPQVHVGHYAAQLAERLRFWRHQNLQTWTAGFTSVVTGYPCPDARKLPLAGLVVIRDEVGKGTIVVVFSKDQYRAATQKFAGHFDRNMGHYLLYTSTLPQAVDDMEPIALTGSVVDFLCHNECRGKSLDEHRKEFDQQRQKDKD